MNKKGPIVIIEDDNDDREILLRVFKQLKCTNEIIFLPDGVEAFDFLIMAKIKPFFILSDINIPKLNGLELRAKIENHEDLRLRCIPFIFFSSSASPKTVLEAYSRSVQGFFAKPNDIDELEKLIKTIIDYWQIGESPNDIDYNQK